MAVIVGGRLLQIVQPFSSTSPSVSSRPSPQFPSKLYPSIVLPSSSLSPFQFSRTMSQKQGSLASGAAASSTVSTSTSQFSGDIGEILGDVTIFAATGESVAFKDLWDQNEGLAVVAFLRHFGCPFCWEFASVLKESKPRFDSAGLKLIVVGVGTPEKACMLAERLPFPLECLFADPECKAYDVLGLYSGFGRTFFNPASMKAFSRFDSLKKAVKNYTIKATPDGSSGVLQQGGVFVFKGKQLLYAWKDEGTGDHAPLDEIFDVCCKVQAA
ncbi:hypothetical protein Ancab_003927 [Ancistrocladus abbreviatus]